jgi:hypothetical protein
VRFNQALHKRRERYLKLCNFGVLLLPANKRDAQLLLRI